MNNLNSVFEKKRKMINDIFPCEFLALKDAHVVIR